MKMLKASVGRSLKVLLLSGLLLPIGSLRAAPQSHIVGPTASRIGYYEIGHERLKLKAILLDSNSIRDIRDAVESYRNDPGTNDWSARIGYVDIDASRNQALILSWVNLDANESGWVAITRGDGEWQFATNTNEKWEPLRRKNTVFHGRTNGHGVFMRVSRVTSGRLAFAFSRVAFFLDEE